MIAPGPGFAFDEAYYSYGFGPEAYGRTATWLEFFGFAANALSGVSTSFRYTLWVVASRLRNRNVRLRESCEWPPSRPTREFIAVAAFGRQLRASDALRSPTPRQSSNLGIRFLVDAFARPQHLVAT